MPIADALPERLPFSSGGNTYYVDSSIGDNSRTAVQAQNPSTPWLTINKAINTVPLSGSIIIAKGTFFSTQNFGSFAIEWTKTGNINNPVTIKAHDDGCTIMSTHGATGGPAFGAWIQSPSATGLRLEGITFNVRGDNSFGVVIEDGVNYIEIYRCRFIETGGGCGASRGRNPADAAEPSTNIRWEACEFGSEAAAVTAAIAGIDCTDPYFNSKGTHYLYLGQESGDDQNGNLKSGTEYEVVSNCIFYGTAYGRHVQIGPQFRNGFVVNNTFYGNHPGNNCDLGGDNCRWYAGTGVEIWDQGGSGTYKTQDVVVANNLFVNMQGHAVHGSGGGGTIRRYVFNNIAFDCDNGNGHLDDSGDTFEETYSSSSTLYVETKPDSSSAPNSVEDPLLADPTNRDFTPEAGSSAIGASLLSWTPEEDFNGDTRSTSEPTIGALEVAAPVEHSFAVTTPVDVTVSTALSRTAFLAAAHDLGFVVDTDFLLVGEPPTLRLTLALEGTLTIEAQNEASQTLQLASETNLTLTPVDED